MGHSAPLTPNFVLNEFLPRGWDGSVPPQVLGNLIVLAEELLEPARAYMGRPIHISSGWRPEAMNARVDGAAKESDHTKGRASDIWVDGSGPEEWQLATVRLFHWMRTRLVGRFGQLILEDHRVAEGRSTALWLHVAIPSVKHPGHGDINAVLLSPSKGVYEVFQEPRA
jgi:hypothetical protein